MNYNNELINKVKLKQKEYELALNNYNNSLEKLNYVYGKYINNPTTYQNNLNSVIKDHRGNKYYVTPQGVLKPVGNEDLNSDCPSNQAIHNFSGLVPDEGHMMNVPLDSSKSLPEEDDSHNYYLSGSSMKYNQPCSYFNQQVSINLPDKSTNKQMKVCTYVMNDPTESNMTEHDDLQNSTLEECVTRAEDLGHDAFGIVKSDPSSFKGTCVTGNKLKVPTNNGERYETKSVIASEQSTGNLTLLKNGELIFWGNSSNYYDNEKNLNTSSILWSSTGSGGITDNKCDPVYGGSINSVNVTYGTNCGLDLF